MLKSIANCYGIHVFGNSLSDIFNSTINNGLYSAAIVVDHSNANDISLTTSFLSFFEMFNKNSFVSASSSAIFTAALGPTYIDLVEDIYKKGNTPTDLLETNFKKYVNDLYNSKWIDSEIYKN